MRPVLYRADSATAPGESRLRNQDKPQTAELSLRQCIFIGPYVSFMVVDVKAASTDAHYSLYLEQRCDMRLSITPHPSHNRSASRLGQALDWLGYKVD